MKIFLTGSHGTGKTFTINELLKNNKIKTKLSILKDLSHNIGMNKDAQLDYNSIEFYNNQRKRREYYVKQFENNNNFIVDRSLVCVLAYTIRGYRQCKNELVKNELFKLIQLLELDIRVIGGVYYYFPIHNFNDYINKNPLRIDNEIYQSEIDSIIKEILFDLNLEYTCMPYSTNRLDNIIKEILGE